MTDTNQTELTKDTRTLGRSDIKVSAIGIGAWSWGDTLFWNYGNTHSQDDTKAAYETARANGINFFDTAEIYGNGVSERLLGAYVEADPGWVVVASKFAPLPIRLSASELQRALAASLERLGTQVIDLYQIHWPYSLLNIDKLMDEMAKAVKAGKIKAVGVSNYSARDMLQAQLRLSRYDIPLASNQVHYNLLHRNPENNGVLQTCRKLNVSLIAYSPLAQGLLTGKFTGPNAIKPSGARRLSPRFLTANNSKLQTLVKALREIGTAHGGKTPAQVALNWLLCRDELVIPIPGAKNAKQAEQNAGALGWRLSDEEFARLSQLAGR